MDEPARGIETIPDDERYCDMCGEEIEGNKNFIFIDAFEFYAIDIGITQKKIFNLFHNECWQRIKRN